MLRCEKSSFVFSNIIVQHYLESANNQTIRVREYNKKTHELCIKFIQSKMERHEIEFVIDQDIAKELIEHSIGFVIKVRHKLKYDSKFWDIDIYIDPLNLYIGEVELSHEDEEVEIPDWAIKEVTATPGFSNYELATSRR